MQKGRKNSKGRMKLAGRVERYQNESLFVEEKPVWFQENGKVSPKWLSKCEEIRNQTTNLLEQIASPINLQEAYKSVKRNGGSGGVDKMTVEEYGERFKRHYQELSESLLSGRYSPKPVKGVEISKAGGGKRQLGIPTVEDRVVQQAIMQVLQPIYDPSFSEDSYGFRPRRDARQALYKACQIVKSGKTLCVDLDLAKFFDEVNHQRLLWLLGTRIGDKRLLDLIERILKTGILKGGIVEQRVKGTPQGSPLSPILSNIVLDELDKELERRGLEFVRYADDMQIFVSSRKSAERIMSNVSNFIEERMKLKVNREKSGIKRCIEVNFLGHSLQYGGKLGLSKQSEKRLKAKIKEETRRNKGISFEEMLKRLKALLQGWLNYFKSAEMKKKLQNLDGWIRRRLRCFRLKQCKRAIGIARFLQQLGISKSLSWRTAGSGKGWWRLSKSPAANIGMNDKWFEKQGYYSLAKNYEKLFCKPI